MKIAYFFRTPSNNVSIERVFESIILGLEREFPNDNVIKIFAQKGHGLISGMIRNMLFCKRCSNNDINHITGDIHYCSIFMSSRNTILTIHDLISLHNPTTPKLLKWFVWLFWYYIPLRKLKYVTCISQATYNDLISFFPWAKKKICIIPNPIHPDFKYHQKNIELLHPRILHVGTRENKNLIRVIEALSGISCHLRIIGELTSDQKNLLVKKKIEYSNRYNLTDEEMINEYIESDIISFPSVFEGFGMPIIEAQATGRPVVTSNIEPMLSVAGEGAIFVNPFDVEDIRNGFLSLTCSKAFNHDLINKGLRNVQKYSITSVISEYSLLYRKIIKSNL